MSKPSSSGEVADTDRLMIRLCFGLAGLALLFELLEDEEVGPPRTDGSKVVPEKLLIPSGVMPVPELLDIAMLCIAYCASKGFASSIVPFMKGVNPVEDPGMLKSELC